jgi:transcriptional regulator with XRE-family HTH domain
MSISNDEKLAFSQRLKLALKRSHKKIGTPTDLALQFNLRHSNDSVTPQAAQKWLSGKARPTVDKINTLAAWLNVSAQWLRYGIPEPKPGKAAKPLPRTHAASQASPNAEELRLLMRIRNLPEHRRHLVTEIIEQFSIEQEIWQDSY